MTDRRVRLIPVTLWGAVWRVIVIVLLALALDAFWLEPSSIRLVKHRLDLPTSTPNAVRGIRIAVIADLHAGAPYIGEEKIREVVTLALAAKPNLILLAGDYVAQGVGGRRHMAIETIAALLKSLHAPLGVYAVLGNHDHWDDAGRISHGLREMGIKVLENQAVRLNFGSGAFYLVGIDDRMTMHDDVGRALHQVPKNSGSLCLTHSPDVFPDLPNTCLLTIAAHTHGGQVDIPILGRLIVPSIFGQRYAAGFIHERGKYMFVSTGIGTSIIPVRFRVPPEVSLIEIH